MTVVAIDGPAGAGKSTVARAVAGALGFTYLDTGAMYRAVGLHWLEHGDPPDQRARELEISLSDRVVVNGRDVTDEIRTPEVSLAASKVATNTAVRKQMMAKQRALLSSGDWVAEGRDIGTAVAPDAFLKIFLTASPEQRAKRRAQERGLDWREVLQEQTMRDEQDRRRDISPLKAAQDAVELDTTDRSIEDVVGQIVGLVRAGVK
jgi:cytidylate kinase